MSEEKQEGLNIVSNRWNTFKIKVTIQDPYIWFNELINVNLKFNKTKAKYDKCGMNGNVFDILPEEYKAVRLSCNINISMVV